MYTGHIHMSPSFLSPKTIDFRDLGRSFVITAALSAVVLFAAQAYAVPTVTLSVQVQNAFTFTTSTNNFTTLTPSIPAYATTTLNFTTNDVNGWYVTLSGDNKNLTNNNLQLGTPPATSTQIADATEWSSSAGATTTASTAAVLSGNPNYLAFRVMTASSTNGAPFIATTWWGTDDTVANAKWAGIPSTTRQIGYTNAGFSASVHVNTVLYYLNVASTTLSGTYNAPITYTGAVN